MKKQAKTTGTPKIDVERETWNGLVNEGGQLVLDEAAGMPLLFKRTKDAKLTLERLERNDHWNSPAKLVVTRVSTIGSAQKLQASAEEEVGKALKTLTGEGRRCETCKELIPQCSFCEDDSRHFIEGGSVKKCVYFCDAHLELISPDAESLHSEDYDQDFEFAAMVPTNECSCDTWK